MAASSMRLGASLPLAAGFLATGALTVLLGVMLPRVAALDHLRDSQSGALLLVQFATSACGALFVRHRFARTLLRGYLLIAAGSLTLLLLPPRLAAAAIGLYGLGLGMAMTSTSMLMGRLFPAARGSALSILNFCWSIGATLCPIAVARIPAHFSLPALVLPIAAVSAALAVATIPAGRAVGLVPCPPPPEDDLRSPFATLLVFSAIGFLYVGAESAIGGWISTWAVRAVSWNITRSSLAAACFWGALLAGRGLTPLALLRVSERRLHLGATAGAAAGILLLLSAHTPAVLLAGACCAGLMLAPIFPLTIARFLARAPESRNAGWVFAVAGFGGAVFPWLTGLISSGTHSLRAGLLATFAAAVGMLLLTICLADSPRARLGPVPDVEPKLAG